MKFLGVATNDLLPGVICFLLIKKTVPVPIILPVLCTRASTRIEPDTLLFLDLSWVIKTMVINLPPAHKKVELKPKLWGNHALQMCIICVSFEYTSLNPLLGNSSWNMSQQLASTSLTLRCLFSYRLMKGITGNSSCELARSM